MTEKVPKKAWALVTRVMAMPMTLCQELKCFRTIWVAMYLRKKERRREGRRGRSGATPVYEYAAPRTQHNAAHSTQHIAHRGVEE